MVEKNNRDLQINIKSMESRLFQALNAFKGADGCEANLFEEFKKIAEVAFFSGHFPDFITFLRHHIAQIENQ